MTKSRFTEAQIIGMIKEQEDSMVTADVCRRHGLSPASFGGRMLSKSGMWAFRVIVVVPCGERDAGVT